MFKRKECQKCGKKLGEKSNFCSNCGNAFNQKKEDWGMLGRDDLSEPDNFSNSLFGGVSGRMLNNMIGSAMKMLEREMQKEMRTQRPQSRSNVRLSINGQEIDMGTGQPRQKPKQEVREIKSKQISQDKLKKISKLPKKEPETEVRRLADKIIYELKTPGVKSIDDVGITRFEKSTEIKALAKDKAYVKIIPINLPITSYELEKGKVILELDNK